MSELRQDPTTGAYVIIAPGRSRRPHASAGERLAVLSVPAFDADCPFCPGNEAQLPGVIAETAAATAPGWSVRIVPNKYPALVAEPAPLPADAQHGTTAGYGFHEVIIESPRHNADLTSMDRDEVAAVVASYHARFSTLSRHRDIAAVVLFRNHGARSGASLVHPHAQALALPILPPKLQTMIAWGNLKGGETGSCPTCAELARESNTPARIVEESRSFLALVPYAAECPFEQWLVPKRHQASFCEATAEELQDLALLLRSALRRLEALHGDPPYSYAIESAGPALGAAPFVHWRLRIVPDLVAWGGFERGAGMPINPSAPEADAAALRAAGTEADEKRGDDA